LRRKALRNGTPTERTRLNLFVYGTLKRGQSNHERFCRGLISAREATVRGRLYELPFGFPALVVPEADVRATGTTDYLADAEASHEEAEPSEMPSSWDAVQGELLAFDDPEERLPVLDRLEGFRPGEKSLYRRVLIPATLTQTGTTILAWAYAIESASGLYLPGGHWPAL
jgi:gamma-glutamylcyclotransferase (GGCT)/AIG2-like uncharacterized protein YtfP